MCLIVEPTKYCHLRPFIVNINVILSKCGTIRRTTNNRILLTIFFQIKVLWFCVVGISYRENTIHVSTITFLCSARRQIS
jgi:hypothetical protein